MNEYKLDNKEYIELHDLLKVMGLCSSGGMAKIEIAAGAVSVDGKVELRKRCKIRPGQQVEFEGRKIRIA